MKEIFCVWVCDCDNKSRTCESEHADPVPICSMCGSKMYMKGHRIQGSQRTFNILGYGYAKPVHATSLGINPSQIEEHKQLYPDIKLDSECRPVFENFRQQDAYLKKTGFDKLKW